MTGPLLFRSEMSANEMNSPQDILTNHTDGNGSLPLQPNSTTTPGSITFPPSPAVITQPFCQWILYEDVKDSRIRIWDLIILIPNALFLMFIIWCLKFTISKLRQTRSPIVTAFYLLVVISAAISVLRCIVGMTVNATVLAGDITDKSFETLYWEKIPCNYLHVSKVLWLVLRFVLLATELSVIVFGLAFGHLDSRTSIQRVLLVTSTFAFLYSCIQGTLEFRYPDPKFHVDSGAVTKNYDIFAHGGMIFWMTSSGFFTIVYSVIFVLPYTAIRHRVNLPSKKSFYLYCLFLAILNCTQAVGSSLLYVGVFNGMCVVDATTYLYFTCFHPLVYGTFLREFFKTTSINVPFSYKFQTDEEDTVSLPYQTENKDIPDNISDSGSFDSTHFDRQQNLSTASVNADIYVPSSYSGNSLYQNA